MYILIVRSSKSGGRFFREIVLADRWSGSNYLHHIAIADGLQWERVTSELVDRLAIGTAVIDGELTFYNVKTVNDCIVGEYGKATAIDIFRSVCNHFEIDVLWTQD